MEYERIYNKKGQIEGIKILSTGKIIKCNSITTMDNSFVAYFNACTEWCSEEEIEYYDFESKTMFSIKYEPVNKLDSLARIIVKAENFRTSVSVGCSIIQNINKVTIVETNMAKKETKTILETNNVDLYTQAILGVFDQAKFISRNYKFQEIKGTINQFAQEQATKMINYATDNADTIIELLENKKNILQKILSELMIKLSKNSPTSEKANITEKISRISFEISSYNDTILTLKKSRKSNKILKLKKDE